MDTQARGVYLLLLVFFVWTLIVIGLGVQGVHASQSFLESVPFLWQSCVLIAILMIALLSRTVRNGLRGMAASTPWSWLVFVQVIRVGALSSVLKGLSDEITSTFVYWVGIPDFLFGLSAAVVGWLLTRRAIGRRFLRVWSLAGAAIILVPTFGFMSYWMDEPGFMFIFEFPMVLAPSVVVPLLICLNFLLVWGVSGAQCPANATDEHPVPRVS